MSGWNHTVVTYFQFLSSSSSTEIQGSLFCLILFIYLSTLVENILIIVITMVDAALHSPMYFFLKKLSFLETAYNPQDASELPHKKEGRILPGLCHTDVCLHPLRDHRMFSAGRHGLRSLCGHMLSPALHNHDELERVSPAFSCILAYWGLGGLRADNFHLYPSILWAQQDQSLLLWPATSAEVGLCGHLQEWNHHLHNSCPLHHGPLSYSQLCHMSRYSTPSSTCHQLRAREKRSPPAHLIWSWSLCFTDLALWPTWDPKLFIQAAVTNCFLSFTGWCLQWWTPWFTAGGTKMWNKPWKDW